MIRMRKDWQLHLLLLLPLTVLLIYNYLPMTGIVMAFQNYKPAKGIWGSTWVGMKNFRLLFSMQGFLYAIRNSFTIAIAKIVLNVAVPVSFALLLNEMRNAQVKKTVQTIVYMPHFISWVLMASIVIRLLSYNGVVNKALEFFGGEKQIFLANKKCFSPLS